MMGPNSFPFESKDKLPRPNDQHKNQRFVASPAIYKKVVLKQTTKL
jgi:hypothetical protein